MLQLSLADKVAIVTGGGSRIGRAIALEFAKAGADVVVGSRKLPNLEKSVEEIKALGRRALAVPVDVRIPEQVDNLVQQAVANMGHIDILVNDAGTTFRAPPEEIGPEGWNSVLGTNLNGAFYCSRAVGKVMIAQGKGGKIINISSGAGLHAAPEWVHYGVAKAGVISLTKSLAAAWAKYNIRVNCIAPGPIGAVGDDYSVISWTPESVQASARRVPLGRLGKPEEIAYTALFLASDASSYITGETISVAGGPS